MTTFPKVTKPDSGLTFRYPTWAARYYRDGKQLYRTLGTTDIAKARLARDQFYGELAADGATESKGAGRKKGGSYIYDRPRFEIRVPGHKTQYADTLEQAEAIRDSLVQSL